MNWHGNWSVASSIGSWSEDDDTQASNIPSDPHLVNATWNLPSNSLTHQYQPVHSFPLQSTPLGVPGDYGGVNYGEYTEQITSHPLNASSASRSQVDTTRYSLGGDYLNPLNGSSFTSGPSLHGDLDNSGWEINAAGVGNITAGLAGFDIRSDIIHAEVEIMSRNTRVDPRQASRPVPQTIPVPSRRARSRIPHRQSLANRTGRVSLRTAERSLYCPEHPELSFVNPASLKRHMKQTRGHTQHLWECEGCGAALTRQDALARHRRTCRHLTTQSSQH